MQISDQLLKHKIQLTKQVRKIQKVLLFRIPTIKYETFDIVSQKRSGYNTYQAISIASLGSNFRQQLPEIGIKLVDLEYESLKVMFDENRKDTVFEECVQKALEEFNPDFVGMSVVFSPGINNGYRATEIVKTFNPNIIVGFGGVHCTFDYEKILNNSLADVVFLNEADHNFPNYIRYLNGNTDEIDLQGLAFLDDNGKIIKIPYGNFPDFEQLPMPAWDLIPTKEYYKLSQVCGLKNVIDEPAPTAILHTERGCIARCTFCTVRNFNGLGVRGRSPETVLKEIDILYHEYGIRYLEVIDDDFSYDIVRANAICRGLIDRNYDLIWSLDNGIRLMTITEEFAENLYNSGCRLFSVGVESGNKDILHRIKKPLTLPGLYKKMEMLRQFPELYVKGNFILGFPFETYAQMEDTFRVANEVGFDWAILSIYSPLIGTEALNYFDSESRDEIEFSEQGYGHGEILPDGYATMDDFQNRIYIENLKINFIQNPNYLGRNPQRALKDFLRIVNDNSPDHAPALYCISQIYESIGEVDKATSYMKQHHDVLAQSEKWRFYCQQIGLLSPEQTRNVDYTPDDFRSGREMEGNRVV